MPNGDERDKDIANAIRYAIDNGAKIINMSFGKDWSPQKDAVDKEALRYADSKGVLMIQCSPEMTTTTMSNPLIPPVYKDGKTAALWIEVGCIFLAITDSTIAASFELR